MKRIVINKPQNKKCEICQKDISLYSFASHLKFSHQLTSDEYALKYGEFRKPKRQRSLNRDIKQIKCGICEKTIPSVGMFTHLRDTHNITPDDYVNLYEEYRPSKLREKEYKNRLSVVSKEEKQQCIICNKEFASGNLLGGHIKREHLITKKEYVLKHIFKGMHPKCECGCGKNVKILYYFPYKVDYVSGHNKNPMLENRHTQETKMKMSVKAIERIEKGIGKTIDTEPELRFKSILDKFQIEYVHPCKINLGNRMATVDFYIPEKDVLVEIDGEYWHPEKLENLNFYILPNVISDKQKEVLDNMIRIRSLDLDKYESLTTKEELLNCILGVSNSNYTYNLTYTQPVINKEYFQVCLDKKGKNYLKSNVWLLLKFVRLFQPNLPYPDLEENLNDIIDKISNYDFSKVYNPFTNEFSNNTSTVGHNYLKHHFHSYWKSKFNGNPSPVEAWLDDKLMKEVIEYRIGCNNTGEVFDFSFRQLVKGLSARRISISFFKPVLAASIYKHYLGVKSNPVVLDPCCGFGGRLLGFKSIYPNGTYVGCEPNIETYNELLYLKENANWNNVKIFNCKFKDYKTDINYDLIFTSIPYYDLEVYINDVNYESFDEWKNSFIKSIERYSGKNCYINAPEDLCMKLGWNNVDSYILSNRSHFDKGDGDKKEWIVKL
jgi:hypothetical protein